MHVTVLGASPVRPNPGRACTGFLLEAGADRYLVDCGTGVLSQLLRHTSPVDLEAVLISHAHPDHCLDLVNIRQALAHSPGPRRLTPLRVYADPETLAVVERLGAPFAGAGEDFWAPWIAFCPIDPARPLDLPDGLTVRFAPARHYVTCFAMRFEHAGRVLAFTADTGPSEAVTALASGAHVLICEATLADREGHGSAWGHLSAAEAGAMAAEAGVGFLILTHYFVEFQPARLVASARAACDAPVEAAQEGMRYAV